MYQDNFYKKTESNSYFLRWKQDEKLYNISKNHLRSSKEEILNTISSHYKLKNKKVLEIGCFIGDLLKELKKTYNCNVHGIEPSSLATNFAKKYFKLNIENSTFLKSKYFSLKKNTFSKFDVIVCDDVLSWIDRNAILPTLGVIDWLLKPDGIIFIRDFSPPANFAYKNHHWEKIYIYNFKQKLGHKVNFLDSGKYIELFNNTRITSQYQKVKMKNNMGLIWSDSILKKIAGFTHPIIEF
jgi:2-polyprenyl-3-methyl-5-hydroxy-6-metoxy-1,4-benzoquinol methylase